MYIKHDLRVIFSFLIAAASLVMVLVFPKIISAYDLAPIQIIFLFLILVLIFVVVFSWFVELRFTRAFQEFFDHTESA